MSALAQADATPAALPADWLSSAERALRLVVEVPAAILVAAEAAILFAGIVSRAIGHSIIWSDELASILFLWLAMLGSVVAVQRGEHMRLTFVVGSLSPRARAWCEALAVGMIFAFVVLLMHAAYDYTEDQSFVETPALGWSGTVRALAVPVGFVLALLACGLRLARHRPADLIGVGTVLLGLAALLALAAPALAGMGNWALLVFFVGLLGIGILAGVPIAFSFALATSAYLLTTTSTPLTIVVGRMDEGMSSLILLAIPLFVLLGQLVDATGMARVMVAFLASLLGHVKAGMSYVLLGAMLLVSASPARRPPTWRRSRPSCFPRCASAG